jgi:hypothetical protein
MTNDSLLIVLDLELIEMVKLANETTSAQTFEELLAWWQPTAILLRQIGGWLALLGGSWVSRRT